MPEPWWNDRPLRTAMTVGFFLRLAPMLAWIDKPCVRDECTYQELAQNLLDGKGMTGTHGWLWAPAYPTLMAMHQAVFGYPGTIEITQLVVATLSIAAIFVLGRDQYGAREGRWGAWLYAVNPTMIFYTTSLWSETLYSGLLLAAVLSLGRTRERGERPWLPGVLLGLCVLFRGVATYMLPVFLVGFLWDRWRDRVAWRNIGICALSAVLTVAPYSLYASTKWGELVVADRTMGQMMWLGNNDFAPMTFDFGNGALSKRTYARVTAQGREACEKNGNPIEKDDCDAAAGVAWIKAHPDVFLERVPVRVAQLLNPHSFLTRHLRWGRWRGLPDWMDEALIASVVVFSFASLVGGTVGFFARGRGWYAATSGLIVLYHVAAISVLAGLTRYRVPLEPLWMVHAGVLFATPRDTLRAWLRPTGWRVFGIIVTVVLVGFMLRFLPSGWPGWRSW
jgi:4-amino-4-deoxy-L-arabinose transferase-like glycosyltransferase